MAAEKSLNFSEDWGRMAKQDRQEQPLNLPEYIRCYGFVIVVWLSIFPFLAFPKFSIPSAVAQTLFLLGLSYFGHILAHILSETGPLSYLNPHIFIHHHHWVSVPRWLNLVIETLTNLAGFLVILPLQWMLGVQIFSTSLVVGTALLYVLIHIADYSILGNAEHKEHHRLHMCNYAPDFMDVLFGTRCDEQAPYTQQSHEVLHGFVAFALAYAGKLAFKWD